MQLYCFALEPNINFPYGCQAELAQLNRLAVVRAASQLVTRSTRHSLKSYDELTGG